MDAFSLKHELDKTAHFEFYRSDNEPTEGRFNTDIKPGNGSDKIWRKKLLHYCNWCLKNHSDFKFEQIIYNEEKPYLISTRQISLSYKTPNHLEVTVSEAKPITDKMFGNQFDRNILDSMEDVFLISEAEPLDLPGPRVLFVNSAFHRMTGYQESEILGRTPRLLQCENTTIESRSDIRKGLASWKPFKVVLRNKTKSGEEFDVELSISPVADETGWYTHWISIQRDITAREKAITQLAQANVILKSVNMGTWSICPNSESFTWDDNCTALHNANYTNGAQPIERWTSSVSECSRDSFEKELHRVMCSLPECFDLHYEKVVNGEARHIKLSGKTIINDQGTEKLVGVAEDITAQYKADEKLSETMLWLNAIIEAGKIGMWDWDLVTNQVRYSKEYKKQIGYEEDELKDDFAEFESRVHPDDLHDLLKKATETIEQCRDHHKTEFRFRHKDGSYRWIWAHASVIKNKKGKPVRLVGSHIDITDQKQLEAQLRQAQKMEAIGQLAGGIAHDFNNHLASIIGFAELLSTKLEDSSLQGYVKKILTSAEGSSLLTRKLLTFSRQDDVTFENVSIHEQIFEVLSILSHSLDKRIQLHTDLSALDNTVLADKALVQSILLNLALNAKDAMPDGGILRIETRNTKPTISNVPDVDTKSVIQIRVSDTGTGIAKSDISKIFDPFFTTKDVGKGTGLGLSTAYSAVTQFKGAIDVESRLGKGTSFIIELPLIQKIAHARSLCDSPNIIKEDIHSKTILVVEDDSLVSEMLQETLEVLGHKSVCVENGKEALALYEKQSEEFDAVILDMNMPIMGGKETFKALKQINADVKVIISTGYSAEHTASELLANGVCSIISKPYKIADIDEVIRALP